MLVSSQRPEKIQIASENGFKNAFISRQIVSELGRLKKNFCMTISFPLTEKFYIIHNAPPLIVFVLDKCCVLATEIF